MLGIRYVHSSDLPRGRQVVVAEGDGELVVMIDCDAPREVLLDALTRTMTAYAQQRWLYVGDCQEAPPQPSRQAS